MNTTSPVFRQWPRPVRAVLSAALLWISCSALFALPWTPLANTAPGNVQTMILLSDGTVMAHDGASNTWFRLTPDNRGSYVSSGAQWTTRTAMASTRRFFTSAVLVDGRLLVAGAEYGNGWNTSEIYEIGRAHV